MAQASSVALALDADGAVALSPPVLWAAERLERVLAQRGVAVRRTTPADAEGGVIVTGGQTALAQQALAGAGRALPDPAEALALLPTTARGGGPTTLATGSDARGITYALLELADRAACAADGDTAMQAILTGPATVEQPANRIRSVMRLFTSDIEDKGWYHDRQFWTDYLSMLATHRFNRFHLALGIGYDFARNVRDSYFYFPYPFLLSVPGYDVRAEGVSDEERAQNLAMLRFIAAETRRRGLHFQLGLWAHVYVFQESPEVNHSITGLTPATHAAYCRDALAQLLQTIPEIDGLTFRVHGESGIPEGSYDFWRTVFSAVAGCGRRVEMDLHAKGIDQRLIEVAVASGQPVTVSPKFWAEHMGLPYHQADIRAVEQPGQATGQHATLMALSAGSRRFTRYGYADLLTDDRRYGILWRVWPGTHRLLLWGDPVTGAAYSRAFSFCGSLGVDLCEPLSFSGRRGSGLPDGRDPYADAALRPDGANATWEKYAYTYRLWGRLLYNPAADPETWRRSLRRAFGAAAPAMEAALANASRILPLITTAHHPSAANNSYWPDVYTNMPIVDESRPHPYRDTAAPRLFGNVSALDPELFATVEEYADELANGRPSGRYSPAEVARWLDDLATRAMHRLNEAEGQSDHTETPEFRRWAIDVRVEAALGRFFAEKLRAAIGYALFERGSGESTLRDAIARCWAARAAWVEIALLTRDVHKSDLTFGPEAHLRGHWADRLAAIDGDLADMEAASERVANNGRAPSAKRITLAEALEPHRPSFAVSHQPPERFMAGEPLPIRITTSSGADKPETARLHYRHVNQAERFVVADLRREGEAGFATEIPAAYTQSPYPLQYYVELRTAVGTAAIWPGFDANLANQPYVVVATRD